MLQRVTVLARPFGGFQNVTAYQLKQGDESGDPVTRILPRVADGAAGLPELHEPGSLDPVDPGAGRWARRRWSYDWTECGDRRLDRIALQGNGSARPHAAGSPAVEQAGHGEQHGATHPGARPRDLTASPVQGW